MTGIAREASTCWAPAPVRRWGVAGGFGNHAEPSDPVAEEVPVALAYNGISHVVMMLTPADLEDFAIGFSLSEGIVAHPGELRDIEVHERPQGLEVDVRLAPERDAALRNLRRNLTGRTGCGLCGAESLQQAVRDTPRVPEGLRLAPAAVDAAVTGLSARQPLAQTTGGTHGAAWCDADGSIRVVREDVGRHNALDKLIGALARAGAAMDEGFAVVSSRASYEMVTKSARARIQLLAAVSAPTRLAVRLAADAGLTLVAFARPGRLSVYSAPARLDS